MDEKITSRDNPKVKYACKLADSPGFRRSEGRFFAEGRKLCPELAKGAALEQLFYTAAAAQKCPELAGLPGQHFLVEEHVAQKAGRRARPAGGVRGVPYPAAYLGRGAARGAVSGPRTGAGPRQRGHPHPQRSRLWLRRGDPLGGLRLALCAQDPARFDGRGGAGPGHRDRAAAPGAGAAAAAGHPVPGGSAGAFRTPWPGPGRAPRRGCAWWWAARARAWRGIPSRPVTPPSVSP